MEQKALLVDQNNIVVNVIVAPEGDYTPPYSWRLVVATGNMGDTWDGTKCSPTPPLPAAIPETLTRWQFFATVAQPPWSIISQTDALAAVQTGTLPKPFTDFIAALPADQQFAAQMLLAGTDQFNRHHPFVEAFLQARGMTDAQADAIWTQGATLVS